MLPKEGMQLNKFLALAGVTSRRGAVSLIKTGHVTVDGIVKSEPGYRVIEGVRVVASGKLVQPEQKLYILLNKPAGYVTTVTDDCNRKTVIDLLGKRVRQRVYPVGRLDMETSGLLLLTNDGHFAQHIMHPRYKMKKRYQVILDRPVSREDLAKIRAGVSILNEIVAVDEAEGMGRYHESRRVNIVLHSGKNQVVRRIFDHFSYKVLSLDRVGVGHLNKTGVPLGMWRFLTPAEVVSFKLKDNGVASKR